MSDFNIFLSSLIVEVERIFIFHSDSNQRLMRVRQWLSPLSKLKSFEQSQELAEHLIAELKKLLQESTQSGELASGLMTIVRLIHHLCIPPDNQFVVGAQIELKYDMFLLKLYSLGFYSLTIRVLEVSY